MILRWWKARQKRKALAEIREAVAGEMQAAYDRGDLDKYHVWTIHGPNKCANDRTCCFHKPSDHHMVGWPMFIRLDRRDILTERTCPHGVGHPDPDSLAWIDAQPWGDAKVSGVHGCDGCCTPPVEWRRGHDAQAVIVDEVGP